MTHNSPSRAGAPPAWPCAPGASLGAGGMRVAALVPPHNHLAQSRNALAVPTGSFKQGRGGDGVSPCHVAKSARVPSVQDRQSYRFQVIHGGHRFLEAAP